MADLQLDRSPGVANAMRQALRGRFVLIPNLLMPR